MFGLFKTTRERVADLEVECVTLGAQVKALRQEWDSFHDMATRRAARDRKRERDDPGAPNGDSAVPPQTPATHGDPRTARLLKRAALLERVAQRGNNGVRG